MRSQVFEPIVPHIPWRRAPDFAQAWFRAVRDVATVHAGRLPLIADGASTVRGVMAVALHGDAPGHVGCRIDGGGEALLIWGDTALVAAVQFGHPAATLAFDIDAEAARATRLRTFRWRRASGC